MTTARAKGKLRRGERINERSKNIVDDFIFELPSIVRFVEVREQIDRCIQNNGIIKLAKLYLKWNVSVQKELDPTKTTLF
jgi:hypothetical protein